MNNKERVFHAIMFEALALAIIVPVASLATGSQSLQLMMVGIGMSIFTVIWNYVYNIQFDKWVSGSRSERSMLVRAGHAIGFEAGLILFTIPAIAWFLQVSLWMALLIEAGFLVFFFFYTTIFNWIYDKYQPYQRWLGNANSH
ncbi:PACE efflux transporter [Vibrio methylphosphonaticus]|uniref:PACE efflux transporter n=1 Tax=Vibrio methylphosphonaticus TaxID=2946866 RepID=UPI00202A91EE|nr:PACE efflux transporter [Vibrio methylphosphonaticus]MCL9774433.1 PACE efflux transporter [Vibrio methylphosphonaticus]